MFESILKKVDWNIPSNAIGKRPKYQPLFCSHASDVIVEGEGRRQERRCEPGAAKLRVAVARATARTVNGHVKTSAKEWTKLIKAYFVLPTYSGMF